MFPQIVVGVLHILTVAIFILHELSAVKSSHGGVTKLTKRENASLNSETCSSVNESACSVAHVSARAYRCACGETLEGPMAGFNLEEPGRRPYHNNFCDKDGE